MKKSQGFTFVELLVVVAIIGLLASIVVVALQGLRGDARLAGAKQFAQSVHNIVGSETAGEWRLEGNTDDSSGYGNNATISGSPAYVANSALGGTAMSFDGIDDFIFDTSLAPTFPADLTISAWINSTFSHIYQARIVDLASSGSYGIQLSMSANGRIGLENSGGPTNGVWSQAPKNDGEWHHMTVTREGSTYTAYIDGVMIGSTEGSVPTYMRIFIGKRAVGSSFFNGIVDEVNVYTKALTSAQIQQIYAERIQRAFAVGE